MKLSDVCQIFSGGTPSTKNHEYWNGDIPWLSSGETRNNFIEDTERKITEKGVKNSSTRLAKKEDIVVASAGQGGTRGQVSFCLIDTYVNQSLIVLRPKREILLPKFLFYNLKSRYQELRQFSDSHSSRGSLPKNVISTIEIMFPSISVQDKISKYLFDLDFQIENLKNQNQILEQIIQSIFKSWFVDFDGQIEFVDSELGEIPKGWKVKPLESILSEIEVGSRPKGGVSDIKTGIPSIGAESIVSVGIFDYSKTKYIPYEFFMKMKRGLVKSRDVLLYKDGGKPGNFEPHVTLVGDGFPFEKCVINEHVYRLRTNGQITQNFLYFWLSSQTLMNEMRMKGTGAAIPGLNSTQVKSLSVLVPDKESVLAFDINSEPLVATILSNSKMVRLLTILRDTLLPKLMSGKIRV